jgi:DNA-binding NarL/FixJ family response regulator
VGVQTDQMSVRVLIVDDQAPFRQAARLVIDATDGFELVGESESGEDSVSDARELSPDLVLMDVNLTGIDGVEAARQIMAHSPDSVVLLLSTYSAEEYQQMAADCGAAGFLPKSDFSREALTEAWAKATSSRS